MGGGIIRFKGEGGASLRFTSMFSHQICFENIKQDQPKTTGDIISFAKFLPDLKFSLNIILNRKTVFLFVLVQL